MPSLFMRGRVASALLLLLLSPFGHGAESELSRLLNEARAALEKNAVKYAWTTLSDAEPRFAGKVEFDYWLGLAGVRAGEPARASFALERVLAEQPSHAGARLELATAYLQLGRRDAAAAQLDKLERLSPPPAARTRIDALNEQLQRQTRLAGERNHGGYLGAEAGHDDNVGTWPEGLEFFPGATVEALESSFWSVKGGYWYRFDRAADEKIMLSANGLVRRNNDEAAEQFDQDYLNARAEWSRDLDGRNEIATSVEAAGLNLDGEAYYLSYGLGGEWRHRLEASTRLVGGLQIRQIDFDLDLYDYLLSRLTGRLTFQPLPRWRLALEGNLDYEAADEDRPGGDAAVFGLRAQAWYQVAARHRLGADVGYSQALYRSEYQPFEAINNTGAEERDDDRLAAALVWEWFPGERWQVRTLAQHRDQDSSLEAFTYDQTLYSAGLNYYF